MPRFLPLENPVHFLFKQLLSGKGRPIQEECSYLGEITLETAKNGQAYYLCPIQLDRLQADANTDRNANIFSIGSLDKKNLMLLTLEDCHFSIYADVEERDGRLSETEEKERRESVVHLTANLCDKKSKTNYKLRIHLDRNFHLILEDWHLKIEGQEKSIKLQGDERWTFHGWALLYVIPFADYIKPQLQTYIKNIESEYTGLDAKITEDLYVHHLNVEDNLKQLSSIIIKLKTLADYTDNAKYHLKLQSYKKEKAGIETIQANLHQSLSSLSKEAQINLSESHATVPATVQICDSTRLIEAATDAKPTPDYRDDEAFNTAFEVVKAFEKDISNKRTIEDAVEYDKAVSKLLEEELFLPRQLTVDPKIKPKLEELCAIKTKRNDFCVDKLRRALAVDQLEEAENLKHFCVSLDSSMLLLFIKQGKVKTLEFILNHGEFDVQNTLMTAKDKETGEARQLSLLSAAYYFKKPDIFKLLLEKFQASILKATMDGFPLASIILFPVKEYRYDENANFKDFIYKYAFEYNAKSAFFNRLCSELIACKKDKPESQHARFDEHIMYYRKLSRCENKTNSDFYQIRREQVREYIAPYIPQLDPQVLSEIKTSDRFLNIIKKFNDTQAKRLALKNQYRGKIKMLGVAGLTEHLTDFENPLDIFMRQKGNCSADDLMFAIEKIIQLDEKKFELEKFEVENANRKRTKEAAQQGMNLFKEMEIIYESIVNPKKAAMLSQLDFMSHTMKSVRKTIHKTTTTLSNLSSCSSPERMKEQLDDLMIAGEQLKAMELNDAIIVDEYNQAVPISRRISGIDDLLENQRKIGHQAQGAETSQEIASSEKDETVSRCSF